MTWMYALFSWPETRSLREEEMLWSYSSLKEKSRAGVKSRKGVILFSFLGGFQSAAEWVLEERDKKKKNECVDMTHIQAKPQKGLTLSCFSGKCVLVRSLGDDKTMHDIGELGKI